MHFSLKERLNHIKEHRQHHRLSVNHAKEGLIYAFKSQPNFRYHLYFALTAIFLGFLLGISTTEWVFITLTITLGLVSEMLNTAVESVVDLITTEWRQNAKIAKDVSSGMVLLTGFGAIVVAILIFVPKLVYLYQSL